MAILVGGIRQIQGHEAKGVVRPWRDAKVKGRVFFHILSVGNLFDMYSEPTPFSISFQDLSIPFDIRPFVSDCQTDVHAIGIT